MVMFHYYCVSILEIILAGQWVFFLLFLSFVQYCISDVPHRSPLWAEHCRFNIMTSCFQLLIVELEAIFKSN